MTAAIAVCAVLIIITALGIAATRGGRHARRCWPVRIVREMLSATGSLRARRAPVIADTRDITDPDGARYVSALAGITPPAVATLARVRDRLLALPPDPAGARRLDETQPIPHAVATWGATPAELTEQLAVYYLGGAQ